MHFALVDVLPKLDFARETLSLQRNMYHPPPDIGYDYDCPSVLLDPQQIDKQHTPAYGDDGPSPGRPWSPTAFEQDVDFALGDMIDYGSFSPQLSPLCPEIDYGSMNAWHVAGSERSASSQAPSAASFESGLTADSCTLYLLTTQSNDSLVLEDSWGADLALQKDHASQDFLFSGEEARQVYHDPFLVDPTSANFPQPTPLCPQFDGYGQPLWQQLSAAAADDHGLKPSSFMHSGFGGPLSSSEPTLDHQDDWACWYDTPGEGVLVFTPPYFPSFDASHSFSLGTVDPSLLTMESTAPASCISQNTEEDHGLPQLQHMNDAATADALGWELGMQVPSDASPLHYSQPFSSPALATPSPTPESVDEEVPESASDEEDDDAGPSQAKKPKQSTERRFACPWPGCTKSTSHFLLSTSDSCIVQRWHARTTSTSTWRAST